MSPPAPRPWSWSLLATGRRGQPEASPPRLRTPSGSAASTLAPGRAGRAVSQPGAPGADRHGDTKTSPADSARTCTSSPGTPSRGPAHAQQVLTTPHTLSHSLDQPRSRTRPSACRAGLGSCGLGGRRTRPFTRPQQQAPRKATPTLRQAPRPPPPEQTAPGGPRLGGCHSSPAPCPRLHSRRPNAGPSTGAAEGWAPHRYCRETRGAAVVGWRGPNPGALPGGGCLYLAPDRAGRWRVKGQHEQDPEARAVPARGQSGAQGGSRGRGPGGR